MTRTPKKRPERITVEEFDAMRAVLNRHYPLLFVADGKPRVPLAIGIDLELRSPVTEFSRKQLQRFLGRWCSRTKYLLATVQHNWRYHLDGSRSEMRVEDQARASKTLASRAAARAAKATKEAGERQAWAAGERLHG